MIPALWVVIGILIAIVLGLGLALVGSIRALEVLRSGTSLIGRPDQLEPSLPVGSTAPPFQGRTVSGSWFSSADHSGRRFLLLFAHPGCRACDALIPALSEDLPR